MVNETGIPGPVVKPDENGNSTLAARVEFSLPRIAEQFQNNGGGETSVFTNLTQESEGIVAEAKLPTCNLGAPVPTVSCRITPDGEATFSLQWNNK